MAKVGKEPAPGKRTLVQRHALAVRLTHWIGALSLFVLLASGLQIFNAHPALYWGHGSDFKHPVFSLTASTDAAGNARGITSLFDLEFDTTVLLGASGGFPAWATLPSWRDLAAGRRWHFFFGWIFSINVVVYLLYSVASRHLWRDLVPSRPQLRGLGRTLIDHLRLRFPRGDGAREYNALQKLAYLGVGLGLLPIAIATGLALSPALYARLSGIVDLLGGRQSARTLHFVSATGILLFFFMHVFMVTVSGFWNHVRSMFTGRYALEAEASSHAE